MDRFLNAFFNTVFILGAGLLLTILLLAFSMRSFGQSKQTAIYYPNAPDITVMQIDTGVDFNIDDLAVHIPTKYQAPEYMDTNGHGTHVAGIILKDTCLNVKLIPCVFKNYLDPKQDAVRAEIACLNLALKENVDIVNFSAGGQYPDKDEFEALKKMNAKNIVVVTAAGNDIRGGHKLTVSNDIEEVNKYLEKCTELDKCDNQRFYYYPASYDLQNILKVSNYDGDKIVESSNYAKGFLKGQGNEIVSFAPGGYMTGMTGTSQAAAYVTNQILKEMCNILNEEKP